MDVKAAVSIIICTSNRAQHLCQTLTSLAAVDIPADLPCELIVVDNASTDGTAATVQNFALPNMPVTYLYEGRRGKGFAYNTGMAAARGHSILFTDDDVRLPLNWVTGMTQPILLGRMDAVVGGVRLASHLERPWMLTAHRNFLASTEGFDPYDPPTLIGANMAYAKKVLEKVPAYDVELGPGAIGLCDDSLFAEQLKKAGYRVGTRFDIEVEHHFEPSRLGRRSFVGTAEKLGRSVGYIGYHWRHHYLRFPERLLWPAHAKLALWRLRHRDRLRDAEGMDVEEMQLVQDIAYYRQYMMERKRSRCYDKFGLIKKAV